MSIPADKCVGITRYYPSKQSLRPAVVRHWDDRKQMQHYLREMRRSKKRVTVTEYHPA